MYHQRIMRGRIRVGGVEAIGVEQFWMDYYLCKLNYSYVSNNRVKLIIVLKGNLQLTSMRVVANNRVNKGSL